jgi:ribosomal protein S18 acetylase RimI-like enzyme
MFQIRPLTAEDSAWVAKFMVEYWGEDKMILHGLRVFQPSRLPGFVAIRAGANIGLVTYLIEGELCEFGSLNSLEAGTGVGSALIEAVKQAARQAGCRRLSVTTTNDNWPALRFYQKRGFVLAALYRNSLEQARKFKPGIPLVGLDGIPLRDELELEMNLIE